MTTKRKEKSSFEGTCFSRHWAPAAVKPNRLKFTDTSTFLKCQFTKKNTNYYYFKPFFG